MNRYDIPPSKKFQNTVKARKINVEAIVNYMAWVEYKGMTFFGTEKYVLREIGFPLAIRDW